MDIRRLESLAEKMYEADITPDAKYQNRDDCVYYKLLGRIIRVETWDKEDGSKIFDGGEVPYIGY